MESAAIFDVYEGEELGGGVRSIGVRIKLPFEQGANPFVEQLYTHETFYTRLHQFVRLSSAFIVVGGGIGTTLETLMVWQLLQVRQVTDVPLMLTGGFRSAEVMRGAVADGVVDLVGLARPLAIDPNISRSVLSGDDVVSGVRRNLSTGFKALDRVA